jgi:argininosuccinate synthase
MAGKKNQIDKVVLAYSGGLDTSIIIPWLKENYGCEVVAVCVDLGQGEELGSLEDKAIRTGASKLYILDLKREFITDFIFPTLRAGARYEERYLLGTSFARPLIAKALVEIAQREGAQAVAHGATGKGNDQVRFELTVKALCPDLKIIAPWRDWDIRSREDAIDYAEARGIPIPVTKAQPYSRDRNIWHMSHEGGDLEYITKERPDDLLMLITPPEQAPDQPTYVEIEFRQGTPCAINGEALEPVPLLETLNLLAGANGVGILDLVENRLVGMKSRGVYECPGGTVLYAAHQELEGICLDRETLHYKQSVVAPRYAELVYYGQWYSPLREALDAFVQVTQQTVSGKVRMKLYKGNCTPAGISSPYSLYDQELVTFGEDQVYNQRDADGFINLFGLPLRVRALMEKKLGLKKL